MNKVELRTKTVKALGGNEELIQKVTAFIEDLLTKTDEEIFDLLLQLKFQPEKVLIQKGLSAIAVEDVQKLRGDIATNYKNAHPDSYLNQPVSEYPEDLVKALQSDITLLSFIKQKCNETKYLGQEDLNRILYLLRSPIEKNYYGGLKAMKFSSVEASFFKDVAKPIADYFETFLPDSGLSSVIPEGIDLKITSLPADPFESSKTSAQPVVTAKKAEPKLTGELVFKHADEISRLLEAHKNYLKICEDFEKAVGIPADEVLKKSQKITALLNALKEF